MGRYPSAPSGHLILVLHLIFKLIWRCTWSLQLSEVSVKMENWETSGEPSTETELSLGTAARERGMGLWEYVRWKKENKKKSETPPKPAPPSLVTPISFTYNYPNKNAWREAWFGFLKTHLQVTPETKVLFLPGAEALEVLGYDALGLSRKNMYAIERNSQVAAQVRAQQLGINVVEEELYTFLQTTSQRFSAVLLDYEGGISQERIHSLELLVQRGLLEEKGVLGINLLAKREKQETQLLYLEPYFEEKLEFLQRQHLNSSDRVPIPVLATAHNLNGVRDYGITAILLKMFMGKDSVQVNRSLLEMLPGNERKAWLKYLSERPPSRYHDFLRTNEELRNYLDITINEPTLKKLAVVVGLAHSQPYFVEGMRRVAYVNAHGNNHYYSDFFALDQHKELFQMLNHSRLEKLAQGKQKMVNFEFQYHHLPPREQKRLGWGLSQAADALGVAYAEFFVSERIPEREQLSGEVKTADHREEIVGMLRNGAPDSHIIAKYALSKRNLAAYKANLTRGSYD